VNAPLRSISEAADGASPTSRRTPAQMLAIRDALGEILAVDHPMTVRQVFYQAVGRGVIDKTEGEYKLTIVRLLTEMRRASEIPFDWIADNTRWSRKPQTYSSLHDMLEQTQESYRRALWDNQKSYVEIWLEKDALAGVLYAETKTWDVPLMVTRGYPSVSYLHEAARSIKEQGKPAFLYYFGDHDPSGRDITRVTEAGLREFAGDAHIQFQRVAVTVEQIVQWKLPTRPTKATDSRKKNFEGESVEVDAISSANLKALVRACIEPHVDKEQLARSKRIEKRERILLDQVVGTYAVMARGRRGLHA